MDSNISWRESSTYSQALKVPLWVQAMDKELDALHINHNWDIVPLPPDKKTIGCKRIFKVKLRANGSLERIKARLVAKGYTQQHGIDYHKNFSLIVKMPTIRCIITLAASNHRSLFQLDAINAFLNDDLIEEVYMSPPTGLCYPSSVVCKLNKSIYGLKQASCQWFARLTYEFLHLGFTQSKHDYSLFIKKATSSITIVVVYVDNIIVTDNNIHEVTALKSHLHTSFSIKDLGQLGFFLDFEVNHLPYGIVLTQTKFAHDLLHDCGRQTFKHVVTPLPLNTKLFHDSSPPFPSQHYIDLWLGSLTS